MSKSKTKPQWMRPQDVQTFFTSDVKEMHGKYLPKNVLKTWTEDFVDEDTGELVSIERSQVLIGRGEITRDKLQEIAFHIQSGDIKEVEVCEQDIQEMTLFTPAYMTNYMVEIPITSSSGTTKNHFLVRAQTIPQAIIIAAEFGQMHRGFNGMIKPTRVNILDAFIVPDDHKCIPEAERTPAYMLKDYFKVQVRTEYIDGGGKPKTCDTDYIVVANEVGQAKERIALLLDIIRAEREAKGECCDPNTKCVIRKAQPFEVDCIVPTEYSELYYMTPTKL